MPKNLVQCKVIFTPETGREQAEKIMYKHYPSAVCSNYWEDRQIGANRISYAIVDLPDYILLDLEKEKEVKRVEIIMSVNSVKGKEETCPPVG